MYELELNSCGVNAKIKATILEDSLMREIGFTDNSEKDWYFCKRVCFPKERKYANIDITFNVTIPKNGSDVCINVLDEDFLQPYDYQSILKSNPCFETAIIVKDQVEDLMIYLQEHGVLSNYVKGEYI